MECEFAAGRAGVEEPYLMPLTGVGPWIADWEPMLRLMLRDRADGVPVEVIAARFHESLAALAEQIAVRAGVSQVSRHYYYR